MHLQASDLIALMSAIIAAIALIIGIYAATITKHVATSGFQSAERVKSDTATLLAALRGIMVKAVLYSQQDPKCRDDKNSKVYTDFQAEKNVIQAFLNSPTAIAYYGFVSRKSREAIKNKIKGEEWRLFFLYIGTVLSESNVYSAGLTSAKIEKMFDGLNDNDIEEMSANLVDLVGSIKRTLQDRKYDVLLSAIVGPPKNEDDKDKFRRFVLYLREQRIKDPDVDLFWAAASGDVSVLKESIDHGAKVYITAGEIKTKYKDHWEKFEKMTIRDIEGVPFVRFGGGHRSA